MLRNLLIALLLILWLAAVVTMTIARQWALVTALFCLAWLVEQLFSCATDQD